MACFYLRIATTLYNCSSDSYSLEYSRDLKELLDDVDSLTYELETAEDICFYSCQVGEKMKLVCIVHPQFDFDRETIEIFIKNKVANLEDFEWQNYPIFTDNQLTDYISICHWCNLCHKDVDKCCDENTLPVDL